MRHDNDILDKKTTLAKDVFESVFFSVLENNRKRCKIKT